MRVTVTEGKHRRVQFAGGYGTEEKARVEGQFHRLNFLGGGRTAGIHAKWSSLDRGVRVEFTNPYFFAPRWSLQLSGERWYDNEPAYTSILSGGHATLTYRPGTKDVFAFTLTDAYQSSEISNAALSDLKVRSDLIALGLDPTTGVQNGTLNALAFDARRTTSTNPLDATRGYVLALHVERAGRWVRGTFAYVNAALEGRYYHQLGQHLVLATRAQVGSLRPDGDLTADIPFSKRYFLGGATSLRGWGRYELSPLSGSGLPIGGFSMAEGSLEARVSLTTSIGVVAFLDLGNAWTDPWRLQLNDLRYDVGPGFRYNTPVGPVRVDVGYQLNPIPGLVTSDGTPQDRRWRLHFSIGQAF
jgi:outer membrane protein insertion porin family/translocation and assembly module TamA